jgi:glycosyltransferase involved in cell wall biosynthesis
LLASNTKLVSVITPSYKSEKFIRETINSVLNQTYKNWELVIVDDHSPDNTNEIIENYIKNDKRIKLIKLESNSGVTEARNIAIKEANGKYIAFLDSDDIWLPQKLEKQIDYMNNNNLAITYSAYATMDQNGKYINDRSVKSEITYFDMLKSNHIGNLTGIYDCEKLGKIYLDNVNHEDYVLWLKIMKKVGSTKGIVEPLAKYRVLNNSLSSNKLKALKWQWNIYRNILELDIFRSLYYFGWYVHYALQKRRS